MGVSFGVRFFRFGKFTLQRCDARLVTLRFIDNRNMPM